MASQRRIEEMERTLAQFISQVVAPGKYKLDAHITDENMLYMLYGSDGNIYCRPVTEIRDATGAVVSYEDITVGDLRAAGGHVRIGPDGPIDHVVLSQLGIEFNGATPRINVDDGEELRLTIDGFVGLNVTEGADGGIALEANSMTIADIANGLGTTLIHRDYLEDYVRNIVFNNVCSNTTEMQALIDAGHTTVYCSPSGSYTGTITIPFGTDFRIEGNTSIGMLLDNDLTINFGSGTGYVGSLKIDALTINGHTLTIDNRIGPSGPALEIENINNAALGSTIASSGGVPGVNVGKLVGPVSTDPMVLDSVGLTYEESNVPFTLLNSGVSVKQYWRTPTTLDNTCSSTAEMQALIDAGFEEVFAAGDGSFSGTLNIPFGSNVKIKSSSIIGLVMTGDFSVSLGSGTGYWGSIEFDFVRTGGNTLTIDSQYQNVRIKKLKVEGNSTLASSTTLGDIWINKITGTDTLTVEDTNLHYEEIVGPVIATTGVGTADQGFWWTPTTLDNTCSSTAEMQALIAAGFNEVFAVATGVFSGTITLPFGKDIRIKTDSSIGMSLSGNTEFLIGSGAGYAGSLEIDVVVPGGNTLTFDSRYGSSGAPVRIKKVLCGDNLCSILGNNATTRVNINKIVDATILRSTDSFTQYEEADFQSSEVVNTGSLTQKWWWTPTIPFVETTPSGDDKGLVFTEQISVGKSGDGREAAFGEGDSVPMNYAFHCTRANTTGDTIVNAVDITDILSSDTGSTTGLFGGTATGNYILVGFDQQFQGVKIKSTDCGTIESENVELASWRAGGNKFVTRFMNTNANFPYTQYGNAVCVVPSEQWRFGFDPTTPSTWVQNTLNINGQDITQYWGIFEIITPITQDATIEHMKLHTNRAEINADGKLEFFGLSRYPRTVQSGQGATITNSIFNPQNEAVPYGANFSALFTDNQLTDGATDGFGIQQGIESGMDTSIPLQLIISYYPSLGVTGDVEFTIEVFQVNDGFVHDGTAVPETTTVIDTISTPSSGVRRSVSVLIYADTLTDDGDNLMISVYRDATVGNANDTLASNVIIENVTLKAYFWGP